MNEIVVKIKGERNSEIGGVSGFLREWGGGVGV